MSYSMNIGMPNQASQANAAQQYQPQQAQLAAQLSRPQQSGGCCNCCCGQTNKVSQLGNGGTTPFGQVSGSNNMAKSLEDILRGTQNAQKSSPANQILEALLSMIEKMSGGGANSAAKFGGGANSAAKV